MTNRVDEDRHESDLERLNRIAALSRLGAPLGERGRSVPDQRRLRKVSGKWYRVAAAEPRPRPGTPTGNLWLRTGLLDDHRPQLKPEHERYPLFRSFWRYQDCWSDEEHRERWQAALTLWPRQAAKRPHAEALAFAIALAVENGLDVEAFLVALGEELERRPPHPGLTATTWPLKSLQSRRVLEQALELVRQPHHLYLPSGRLPRVLAINDEPPPLALTADWDPLNKLSSAGGASREIVEAAQLVVEQMKPTLQAAPAVCRA